MILMQGKTHHKTKRIKPLPVIRRTFERFVSHNTWIIACRLCFTSVWATVLFLGGWGGGHGKKVFSSPVLWLRSQNKGLACATWHLCTVIVVSRSSLSGIHILIFTDITRQSHLPHIVVCIACLFFVCVCFLFFFNCRECTVDLTNTTRPVVLSAFKLVLVMVFKCVIVKKVSV